MYELIVIFKRCGKKTKNGKKIKGNQKVSPRACPRDEEDLSLGGEPPPREENALLTGRPVCVSWLVLLLLLLLPLMGPFLNSSGCCGMVYFIICWFSFLVLVFVGCQYV